MKAVYFDGTKAAFRDDLDKPVPEAGESLVRILMSAVCSTDKEILRGYKSGFTGVMGHEFVGIVEESDQERSGRDQCRMRSLRLLQKRKREAL